MEKKIEELKSKLRNIDTKEILGWIATRFVTGIAEGEDASEASDIFNKTNLMSPQKQYLYLAGLLMSTTPSDTVQIQNVAKYEEIENDLQEITSTYYNGFLPSIDEVSSLNDTEKKQRLISASAFLSYFDMGDLRYEEQTEQLINELFSQFDDELLSITGLSINDYLSFYHYVKMKVQESIDKPTQLMESIFEKMDGEFSEEAYNDFLKSSQDICEPLINSINGFFSINIAEIYQYFGDRKASTLMDLFTIERKERDFKYYNDENPFVNQPLCKLGDTIFVAVPIFLLNAIYYKITNLLENQTGKAASKYSKKKADRVEEMFLERFKLIFGDKASYHQTVCEEKGTKEHDLLIEYKDFILIAEIKASKVREPFFNPEKGYKRIYDHFNSDSGIGGGYKQAIILKKLIESNNSTTLYEQKVKPFSISDVHKKTILPLVLTLNQFGEIAINTSQLLEKEEHEPYPWTCNLHDFENIIEIQKYLKKTPDDFINYIVWRISHHKQFMSFDELEIIEQYYCNPSFVSGIDDDTTIMTMPFGPNLIDKIYFKKHGITYNMPSDPVDSVNSATMSDASPFLNSASIIMGASSPFFDPTQIPLIIPPKIGGKKPCPCGSGKRFKRCCKGKGIYD